MNKRLKILIAIFVVSIGVFLYLNNKERGNVSLDDRVFSIGELSMVNTILLSNSKGDQVVLKLEDEEWKANNNLINKQKINELQKVVTGLKVKNRVASKLVDSLLVVFKESSIQVKYLDGTKEMLSYKTIVDNTKQNEVIVLMEGSRTPYYAHVFGEEVNFLTLFKAEITAWSSLVIADFTKAKVSRVCTKDLIVQGGYFCVTASDTSMNFTSSGDPLLNMDVKKGVNYLREFKQIKAKKMFSNKKVIRELVGDQKAFFEVKVLASGKETIFLAFRKRAGLNQVDFTGKPMKFDDEHMYIMANNKLYLIDYFSFEGLMKREKEFLNE